jgi:hypothetical protein
MTDNRPHTEILIVPDVGLSLLFVERLRHADEPERDQAAVGGMCQHHLSFPQW